MWSQSKIRQTQVCCMESKGPNYCTLTPASWIFIFITWFPGIYLSVREILFLQNLLFSIHKYLYCQNFLLGGLRLCLARVILAFRYSFISLRWLISILCRDFVLLDLASSFCYPPLTLPYSFVGETGNTYLKVSLFLKYSSFFINISHIKEHRT